MKRGGYLKLYDLWEWYDVQPKDVQEYFYKSSSYGINTDPANLFYGEFQIFSIPKGFSDAVGSGNVSELCNTHWPKTTGAIIAFTHDQHIPTTTSFLSGHARNALSDRQYEIATIILAEAKRRISDEWDLEVYSLVEQSCNCHRSASEKEIAATIPLVTQFLRENPGFLQSELPKQFERIKEDAVGMAAYRLRQKGQIRREKSGRSFQLWLVE